MKRDITRILILGLFGTAVFAQIEQAHPELCSLPEGTVPSLPAMSIAVDQTQGSAKLSVGEGMTARTIDLPGVIDTVAEVCPLPSGHYLVFGDTYNGMNMLILDIGKPAAMDAFSGFEPVMSPDRRWVVYRKFYPRHHDASISEEYLIYDLTKTAAQNRPPEISLTNSGNVGRPIFPPGRTNLLWDNYDLPDDRMHRAGSLSFYWSADSQLVMFGDLLQDHFAVIAVTIDKDGLVRAYEHSITPSDLCGGKVAKDFGLFVSHAAISQDAPDEYLIKTDFQPMPGVCVPKSQELRFPDDFKPSPAETPFQRQRIQKPAVVDQ